MEEWEKGSARGQGDADLAGKKVCKMAVTWVVLLNEGRVSLNQEICPEEVV